MNRGRAFPLDPTTSDPTDGAFRHSRRLFEMQVRPRISPTEYASECPLPRLRDSARASDNAAHCASDLTDPAGGESEKAFESTLPITALRAKIIAGNLGKKKPLVHTRKIGLKRSFVANVGTEEARHFHGASQSHS